MFGMRRKKTTSVVRGFALWTVMLGTMVVLYCLSSPAHVNIRNLPSSSCAINMPKTHEGNRIIPTQTAPCSAKKNIMFMKTHKAASSTLLNILFRFGEKHGLKFAFPDGRNDFFYPSPFMCSQVRDYQPGDCFNIICNHMRFDAHEVAKLLPDDAVYISILRDPAELFASSFDYYRRVIPLTWSISGEDKMAAFLHDPWAYYTPDAFNSFYLRNLLFFDMGFDNNLDANDVQVLRAIQTLSKHFHLVLIAEYFEESLILLKDLLCWTMEDMLYFKLNVRKGSSSSRMAPELRAKALEWNGVDWRLYQHFNATFWAKVEAYGRQRMAQEVKELRRRNSEMNSICIEGGHAVDPRQIRDSRLLPWQPFGESSILGYNMRKDVDPEYKTLCQKMLTPEIEYLLQLGVNLWLTKLWGWLKDAISWIFSK